MIADLDDSIGMVVLINGIAESYGAVGIAMHLLALLRAGLRQEQMPPLPPAAEPSSVNNAADYAGSYGSGEDRMVITATGDRLTLRWRGQDAVLESRGEDSFYVSHPDLELFLLEFGREGNRIVEAFHGPDWYVKEWYSGSLSFGLPGKCGKAIRGTTALTISALRTFASCCEKERCY